MPENLIELIRELSDIYDPHSMDTYVSLYLNRSIDGKFIDRRIKACNAVLKGEELTNFNDTIEDIYKVIKKKSDRNIVIFASHKHNFLRYTTLPVQVENLMIVDSSPYLRPLARIQDEWESFTLLLISSNYAKIFSVSLGKVEQTKKLSADIMNKHKKGGCSQARFNRLRKGAIHSFFSEAIEVLEKKADERIILAGPGQAKHQFRDMLPKNLDNKIVEVVDISIDEEKELLKESFHIISKREEQQSHEAVKQLKEEILKDGLATYGLNETLKAVKNGQVNILLIEKGYKPKGWICENCQVVEEGTSKKCPYCGGQVSEIDVIEEILEFAERTDAEIEFTDDEEIINLGHVGAILRFK